MKALLSILMVGLMAVPSYAGCVNEVVALEKELITTKQYVGEIALVMNAVGAAAWSARAKGTMCANAPAHSGCRRDMGDFKFLTAYYGKMNSMRSAVTSACTGVPDANVRKFRDSVLEEYDLNVAKLHAMEDQRD